LLTELLFSNGSIRHNIKVRKDSGYGDEKRNEEYREDDHDGEEANNIYYSVKYIGGEYEMMMKTLVVVFLIVVTMKVIKKNE
jgi:hypothetical protein